jgi:hypothetical protein
VLAGPPTADATAQAVQSAHRVGRGTAITSGISFSQLAISAVSGTLEAGGELARLGLARKRGVIGAIDKAGS